MIRNIAILFGGLPLALFWHFVVIAKEKRTVKDAVISCVLIVFQVSCLIYAWF